MMQRIDSVQSLNYRGFIALCKKERHTYTAKVINSEDTIIFSGKSLEEVSNGLYDSIDLYLHLCSQKGVLPRQKTLS